LVVGGPLGWLTSPARAVAAVSALAGGVATLVVEPNVTGTVATMAADLAAVARTARALRATLSDGALHGDAEELAARTLAAAGSTLERLSSEGWASLLGPADLGANDGRLGRSAVVERAYGPTSGARLLKGLAWD
jgi:hypothetical protein